VTRVAQAPAWELERGTIPLDQPVVVGILNVTPDSFSDGGRFLAPDAALHQAETLVADGADMLDLGAESTAPGAEPVAAEEEWRRLEPVLRELVRRYPELPLSVDTVKGVTARRALELGAWAVNDVSGLRLDLSLAEACADHGAGLVLMHSRGTVSEMATYRHAEYGDVAADVVAELRRSVAAAEACGVPRARLVVDPGLGFAKTPEQSVDALRGLPALAALGCPVMVGPSRKRFLGALTGKDVAARDAATAAACVTAFWLGASLFRVHAVAPVKEALAVAHAVRDA
jgi:dihydropteroate synthase